MLVVVSIMMLLVAAAATQMRPATESRRVRESARALSTYLSSARNRAIEIGRPCGVMFHRFSTTIPCAMNLDQCEVPPSYAGDAAGAAMTFVTAQPHLNTFQVVTHPTPAGSFNNSIVLPGDLVQFNLQGPLFTIGSVASSGSGNGFSASCVLSAGQQVPWTMASPAVPYRIYRLPSSTGASTFKGQAQSLQLPASSVVDLDGSGIDGVGTPFDPLSPPATDPNYGRDVGILFSPNGSVYGAYYVGGGAGSFTYVTQPIFLLVGKRERVGATPIATDPATWSNWQDLINVWVVINPQTGLVTTGEVAAVPAWQSGSYAIGSYVLAPDKNVYVCTTAGNTTQPPGSGWSPVSAITAARALARDLQSMGGK